MGSMRVAGEQTRLHSITIKHVESKYLVLVACVLACGLLLTVNLTTWPRPWFDEGLNLSTAATLARASRYGLPDSAGVRVMDPAIQTGPVVLAPLALAFKVFGVGMFQARSVMVLFALFTLSAFVLLGRRLGGLGAALLGLVLLLIGNSDPYTSFVPMARQVLGEVPALGFFCFGCWFWLRRLETTRRATGTWRSGVLTSSLVGVVFGLGMVTKSQLALTLPVAIALIWLADRLYYRVLSWWSPILIGAVAVGCVLCWYGMQLWTVGFDGFQRNTAVLHEGFSIHVASLSLTGPHAALGTLWHTGFLVWGLPGLLYSLWLARRRDVAGLAQAMPLALSGVWLGWYVCLSIGWSRYACLPLLLTTLYSGRLLADLSTGTLRLPWPGAVRWQWGVAPMVVLVLFVFFGRTLLGDVFGQQDESAQQFAAVLRRDVPADAVVETWEWELDILAPQRFHHPDTHVTNLYTLAIWSKQPLAAGVYDPATAQPTYIVEGPFSGWTGIYRDFILAHGVEVARAGDYVLYQVR